MAFDIFLSPSIDSRSGCLLIEDADDQRVDNGLAVLEPSSGNRTRRHQHPFAGSGAERIIGNEPLAGPFLFESDFKERSTRQFAEAFRRPYVAHHDACLHGLVLTSSSFNSRALSRASGVTTTSGPTRTLLYCFPISAIRISLSMPVSMRNCPPFAAGARFCAWPGPSSFRLNVTRLVMMAAFRSSCAAAFTISRANASRSSAIWTTPLPPGRIACLIASMRLPGGCEA